MRKQTSNFHVMVKEPFGKNSKRGECQKAGIDAAGNIHVYDPVAGHYTVCHSLTEFQIRYVRSRCTPSF